MYSVYGGLFSIHVVMTVRFHCCSTLSTSLNHIAHFKFSFPKLLFATLVLFCYISQYLCPLTLFNLGTTPPLACVVITPSPGGNYNKSLSRQCHFVAHYSTITPNQVGSPALYRPITDHTTCRTMAYQDIYGENLVLIIHISWPHVAPRQLIARFVVDLKHRLGHFLRDTQRVIDGLCLIVSDTWLLAWQRSTTMRNGGLIHPSTHTSEQRKNLRT